MSKSMLANTPRQLCCRRTTSESCRPAAWHQAPVHVGRDTVRLHLQLTSPRRAADKLKFLAGSEAAMWAWAAEVPPEVGAARLREAIERASHNQTDPGASV